MDVWWLLAPRYVCVFGLHCTARAMFRSSLGKLSEFPRAIDFRVNVSLSTDQHLHVLGECLKVRYSYRHDLSSLPATDGSPERYTSPRSHDSVDAVTWQHSPEDWLGLFRIPTTGPHSGTTADDGRRTGTLSVDGRVCLNEQLEFDVNSTDTSKETLVAWCLLPPENEGEAAFWAVPATPGHYCVRYFLHGTQCSVGNVVQFESRYVKCTLKAPTEVMVGDPVFIEYTLQYTDMKATRTNNDWIGLFAVDTRNPLDCGSIPVPVHVSASLDAASAAVPATSVQNMGSLRGFLYIKLVAVRQAMLARARLWSGGGVGGVGCVFGRWKVRTCSRCRRATTTPSLSRRDRCRQAATVA